MKVTKKFDVSKVGGESVMFQSSNELTHSAGNAHGNRRAQSAGHTRSTDGASSHTIPQEKKRRPQRPFSADVRKAGGKKSQTSDPHQSQTARGASKSRMAFGENDGNAALSTTKPRTEPDQGNVVEGGGGDDGESPQSKRRVVQKQVKSGRPQTAGAKAGKLRSTVAKSKSKSTNTQKNDFGRKAAALDVLRRKQNEKLLMVLEEEQKAEEEREKKMREVREAGERQRLDKIFGVERARASDRIMKLTEEHERFPESFYYVYSVLIGLVITLLVTLNYLHI